jgi:DNA-binding Lrp family transcriptional regulator
MHPKPVEIDSIDNKIIHILIGDARASLKNIAEECGVSSVSVLNRIKRLKKIGVITGAMIFPALNTIGFTIVATIGLQTEENPEEILKFLNEHTCLIEPSTSIGEYDFCALVYAENVASLNERVETVRRRFAIRKVIVNVWSGLPVINFGNIDLNPTEKE